MTPASIKVCILTLQVYGLGKIGGFGSMTVQLARALRGTRARTVVCVLSKGWKTVVLRKYGICIVRVPFWNILSQIQVLRRIDPDIFHSQNPSVLTLLARLAFPVKKHVVTCRDPKDAKDWMNEFTHASWRRKLMIPFNYLTEESGPVRWSVRNADLVGCAALFLQGKCRRIYGLSGDPIFLPNLEEVPAELPAKSEHPTVCFVGRLEKRKRPELFMEMARRFPQVQFIMIGQSEEETRRNHLRSGFLEIPNLNFLGPLNKFSQPQFYQALNSCWVLANTSSREGLPLSFIEAAGRGCAILSYLNPEDFTRKYGYWVQDGDLEKGLSWLLSDDHWRSQGKSGYDYVREINALEKALKVHLEIYFELMGIDPVELDSISSR